MAKNPDWNDVHRANPGAVRDALTEPDIPFDDAPTSQPNGGNGLALAPEGRRFELIPFSKIGLDTEPAYLVKGIIPREGLCVVWGPPKCGKSFLVFDLVMHIALGGPYRERRVRQGAVVYCALEGGHAFKNRVEAFRQRFLAEDIGDVPFHLMASPMALVADQAALITSIRECCITPSVVVVDTLSRSLAGSESDDRDMAAFIKAADAVREAFNCAVIIVHHCGHEGTRPRGHSSLMGAIDAQIAVKRDAADNIIATVEFMKDGPQGDEFASRLEVAEIGIDDDGDKITSCVIVPVEGLAPQKEKPKNFRPRLPRRSRRFTRLSTMPGLSRRTIHISRQTQRP
jgi:hypothetical protein